MMNMIKNICVFATTGVMAILGLAVGMAMFKPENITFKNNETEKESE